MLFQAISTLLDDLVKFQRGHRTICCQLPEVLVDGVFHLVLFLQCQLSEVLSLAVKGVEVARSEGTPLPLIEQEEYLSWYKRLHLLSPTR